MGCQQSVPEQQSRPVKGVGQTERLVNRAQRIKEASSRALKHISSSENLEASGCARDIEKPTPPKLDSSGNLMPEEVVRRTSSSITNASAMLGTNENAVDVRVSGSSVDSAGVNAVAVHVLSYELTAPFSCP